jgi:hypothetical protein
LHVNLGDAFRGHAGFAVTHITDDDSYETADADPKRGVLRPILVFIALAATGIASGFLWRAYSNDVSVFSLVASVTGSASSTAEKPVGQSDFEALRQQVAAMQSTAGLLAAQQAEIKRLSDQVSALSGKLDLLQRPITSAQAAIPLPAPHAAAPIPRKRPNITKPAAVNPAGAISTGGAPLAPPLQLAR